MIKLIAEEKCCRTTITFSEHNQEKENQYLADFKVNSNIYKIIRIENDEEVYSLAVINNIFGGSISSRLFQKIREENGLSYSVYSYLNSYIRQGSLVIYAGMNPLELEKVLTLINQEISKLKKDRLSKKEIQFAIEQIRSGIIMGLESMSQRMTTYGKKLLMENKVEDINDILCKISKINEENIEASIDRVFDTSKLNVAVLGDVKTKDYKSFFNF